LRLALALLEDVWDAFASPYISFSFFVLGISHVDPSTAILRRRCGKSFKRIAEGIASKTVGGVSMDTVKRWWRRHLEKAGEVAQWVAAELIRAGVKDDLLRLHFKGVNLTAVDTANWLFMLFKRFFNRQQPPIHGFFSSLNFRLPAELWL